MQRLQLKQYAQCLAMGLTLGAAASSANAVQLNPDGLGQALIYPYYTVQGDGSSAYDTMVSIVNNTDDFKAVKVRLREGREGKEVKSFNLFLTPRDVWVAALTASKNGMKIVTSDKTCLSPAIGAEGMELSLAEGVDRLREGYIEAIEMATIPKESAMAANIVHVNGTPRDCAAGIAKAPEQATGPNTGGLSGYLSLMNVQSGYSFSVKATALDHFAKAGAATGYTEPENAKPDLTSAEPISIVSGTGDDLQLISEWEAGTADAVSAVLMHQEVVNEYFLAQETASQTGWVITFPTKPFYSGGGVFFRTIDMDREERRVSCGPLPLDPVPCDYASNLAAGVLFFRGGNLLLSLNKFETEYFSYRTLGAYSEGVVRIEWRKTPGLTNTGKTTVVHSDGSVLKNQSRTYYGWPVAGFSAYTMSNAFIPLEDGKIGRSIYGVTIPHGYVNKIE